jgi:probable F420-dependent oxidoreductase
MRFGFTLPNNFGVADPAEVVGIAHLAEELGFHSVWVNHHVLNVGYVGERLGGRPYHDALTMLTWVAATTQRVRLGTSVLVVPYLHPMNLAKAIATLDQLSGGRVVLGLGVGSLPEENAALGVPYEGRGGYTDEAIDVMRGLWTGEPFGYDGEHFSFGPVVASPVPAQRPLPVVIGGNRAPALRRVAERGDGWHPLGVTPDGIARRLTVLQEHLDVASRRREDIEISVRLDVERLDGMAAVSAYEEAGVDELVLSVNSGDTAVVRAAVEDLATWAL